MGGMLHLHQLRKAYGRTLAVDGVSLSVSRGEVVGLIGPNGAGKSTTIAMATGALAPDDGRIEVGGIGPPTDARVRRIMGLAPQDLALWPALTAIETLCFFARMYGLPDPRGAALVALEEVGLAARADDRVGAYSGGMQRRLNLAAALVHAPSVLLLDEPTAGVDPQSRARIRDIVRQRARDGAAVLLTTHDMEEAEKVCDRIAVMDHGRVLAEGSVTALLSDHAPADANARGLEGVFLHLTGRSLRE